MECHDYFKTERVLLNVRYLDSQLTNPVFVPIDKVEVGTKIEVPIIPLAERIWQAERVMAMIDALPNPEDIATETDVLPCFGADAYEALKETKALVTEGDRKGKENPGTAGAANVPNKRTELNRILSVPTAASTSKNQESSTMPLRNHDRLPGFRH